MVEGDLERAEERAEAGESKIVDLEEELRQIGRHLIITKFFLFRVGSSICYFN